MNWNWTKELLELAWIAVPVVPIWWVVHRVFREREKQKERRPASQKLLRPPGHSVSIQLDDAWFDGISDLVMASIIGISGGAILPRILPVVSAILLSPTFEWSSANSNVKAAVIAIPAVTICWVTAFVVFLRKAARHLREAQNFRLGMRGEQAVGEALNQIDGYRVAHDFPGDGPWNIDHIVVGPGGVFAIETKARTMGIGRVTQKGDEVMYDGETLRFPNGVDSNAVKQVRSNAYFLNRWLQDETKENVWIQPVIAVPGWTVTRRKLPDDAIPVFRAQELIDYLRDVGPRLSEDQVRKYWSRIQKRCRDVEF